MPFAGGRLFSSRSTASGNGRAAASAECRSPSSARFGNRRFHNRKQTSSNVACCARS